MTKPTTRIRDVQCGFCGGRKVSPSKTAYVYCDYCGKLVDWDFYAAVSSKDSALPGPEYQRLSVQIAAECKKAIAQNDAETYEGLQRALFEAHITACPSSYSPRVGDSDYRAKMVEYLARQYTMIEFDPELRALGRAMAVAAANIRWVPLEGNAAEQTDDYLRHIEWASSNVRAESTSFWTLFDAFEKFNRGCIAKSTEVGTADIYPEGLVPGLMEKIGVSAFAAGWLPYLYAADATELINRGGLRGSYRDIDPTVSFRERNCGRCGAQLNTPDGAKEVICEGCGDAVDVSSSDITCTHCGGSFCGVRRFRVASCPYCQVAVRSQ